jgi:hypothetical protein
MVAAIIFVMLVGLGVFKMVYDHQIFKDMEKIRQFHNKTKEDVEQDLH